MGSFIFLLWVVTVIFVHLCIVKIKTKNMTVKELIEQLSKFDPETPVLGSCTDPTDYTYKVEIESIELDSPYDSNGYNGLDGSELGEDDDEDELFDDEGEYIGPKVVVINIGEV